MKIFFGEKGVERIKPEKSGRVNISPPTRFSFSNFKLYHPLYGEAVATTVTVIVCSKTSVEGFAVVICKSKD